MQRDAVGVSGHRRVLAAAAQLEYLTPAVVAGQPDQGEIAGQVVGLGQIQAVRPARRSRRGSRRCRRACRGWTDPCRSGTGGRACAARAGAGRALYLQHQVAAVGARAELRHARRRRRGPGVGLGLGRGAGRGAGMAVGARAAAAEAAAMGAARQDAGGDSSAPARSSGRSQMECGHRRYGGHAPGGRGLTGRTDEGREPPILSKNRRVPGGRSWRRDLR